MHAAGSTLKKKIEEGKGILGFSYEWNKKKLIGKD
jgi:hypothetical protein